MFLKNYINNKITTQTTEVMRPYYDLLSKVQQLEEWKASIDIIDICKKYGFVIKEETETYMLYWRMENRKYLGLYCNDNLLTKEIDNRLLIKWINENQPLIDNLLKKQPKKK